VPSGLEDVGSDDWRRRERGRTRQLEFKEKKRRREEGCEPMQLEDEKERMTVEAAKAAGKR